MANIGNQVTTIPFIADTFSGNSSQQSFTLTRAPAGTASVAVFIGTAYQVPASYTLSGVTLTFVSAPTAGTNNITVLHLGNGSTTQVPSTGSVSLTSLSADTYNYINSAFTAANTGTVAGSYANSAFATANTSAGVNLTQNTNITNAGTYANAAFTQANTDFTNISFTAGVYGNAVSIPALTISANGRITAVTNTAVSGVDAHPFLFTAMGS
jgi:hypothetical protein